MNSNSTSKYVIQQDNYNLTAKDFGGSYHRVGAKLTHKTEPSVRLVIGTRLKTTEHKPQHFLLLMVGRDKPAIYFSSMYPTLHEPNVYELEHQGLKYSLVLGIDRAEVVLLNQIQEAA